MTASNLDEWVSEQDDLLDTFRRRGQRGSPDSSVRLVPPEQTNWIEEQQALVETCAFGDLSHHMTAVRLQGPEVIRFLKEICVNAFDDFEIGRAKQVVMCSHDGYLIGDGPLLRLSEQEFYGPGIHGTKWLEFNLETGEYAVTADIEPPTPMLPNASAPEQFVYQVQGPKAYDVLQEVIGTNVRDIDFFSFEETTIAGRDVVALGHGMASEPGLELIGPYSHADEVRKRILEAGRAFGIRRLGRRAYLTQGTMSGWIPPWPKPVYDSEEMRGYRQWVTPEREREFGKAHWTDSGTFESTFSLEGSFDSDDIRDYYLNPVEIGYGKLIDFSHDFIGKDALRREVDNQRRTLVTLRWENDDVARVNNAPFRDGDTYRSLGDLPGFRKALMPYNTVKRGGEPVGISYSRHYQRAVRTVLSLCTIDIGHSEPGTEVSLLWGEPNGRSPNPKIEDHVQTEIRATVHPAPFAEKKK